MKIGYDGKRAVQNFTGLGNYSRYVLESLVTYAPENEYRLYAPARRPNPQLDGLLAQSGGRLSLHLPEAAIWKHWPSLWRIGGIRSDLERDGIDLFHGLSNELPLTIHRTRGVKSVVTIHDLIFLRLPHSYPAVDRRIYDYKCRYACRRADRIIAVSECTKRDIVYYYGIPEEKISVIYQGCDPAFARPVPQAEREEVCRRYGLPRRYVLCVGTIEERKNALMAVEALRRLPTELHLVLVGRPTAYAEKVKARVAEAGLQQRVHLLHGLPFADLPAVYQCASSFIYPSVYEGFGIPILEALNAGLPVVAAKGSCLEEAGGPHSFYADPTDADALADALRHTLIPEAAARMAEKGRKWAAQFTPEQLTAQTLECYRQALAGW